jgi:hypothetical protein
LLIVLKIALSFGPDDVNALIGRQLRLMVNQNPKGDKIYNNITDVLPVEKDMEPILADNMPSESVKPATGYEKAKAVASKLPGAKVAAAGQMESVADDPTNGEPNPFYQDESDPTELAKDIPF